jgi:amidase
METFKSSGEVSMSNDLVFSSATKLAQMIRHKEIGSVELTQLFIDQIEREDGEINAVIVRRFDEALAEAAAADAALASGDDIGPLHGLPMTIKESYVMEDTPSTWGIESHKDNIADKDGLIVHRFKSAGAHFLGKTNVPVDLSDTQAYNPIYGTTNNPYDLERTPGGSSGGSAAAIAAGFGALEAGSDIGGSIRIPAVFCGVFGHKPTWGIIPLAGHALIEGVPDPDVTVCGPLARSAEDLKLALDVMAGPTEREAVGWKLDLAQADVESLKGLRIAVWPTDDLAPVCQEIEDNAMQVGAVLEKRGAKVSYTARPAYDARKAHVIYQSLTGATMASGQPASVNEKVQNLVAQLDPDDTSDRAVGLRAAVMSHRDWIRHNFRREKLRRAWDAFFQDWDVLICPQYNVPAFVHDHRPLKERTLFVDGVERGYSDYAFWAGIANAPYLPSTTFPTGFSADGLPLGLQATCPSYRDNRSIEVARLISLEIGGFTPPARMLAS